MTEKYLSDDSDLMRRFISSELEASKIPVVWYYYATDYKTRLFLHTFGQMNRYKKTLKIARFPDPTL